MQFEGLKRQDGTLLRTKLLNLGSAALWLTLVLLAINLNDHLHRYFSDTHFFDFFGTTFGVDGRGVLFWFYVPYLAFLAAYYLLEDHPRPSKPLVAIQAVYRIIRHPDQTLATGLEKRQKTALLSIVVKVFFAPLMINWLAGHLAATITNLTFIAENFELTLASFRVIYETHLFWLLLQLILFADVLVFTVGYLVEHPRLGNQIKSVDPYATGWIVAIMCYPPFNSIVNLALPWVSTDLPRFDNDLIFFACSFCMLVLMAIYSWASITLGFKASNLTHRGIVSHGPYAFIRHPAYITKNLFWWLGTTPLIASSLSTGDWGAAAAAVAIMSAWSFVYFLRALTEERHLRSVDGDYDAYASQVHFRFIPRFI